MKRITLVLLCLTWSALAGLAAESLSIDWYTVDAGGGTTSAGEFTLSGTVGQPDADTLDSPSSGFSLFGGYWGQFAGGVPTLNIRLTSSNTLLLSWPAYYTGYVLETGSIAPPSWNAVSATPVIVGAEYQVILTLHPSDPPTFFRLRSQ